jgi:hypothetical protein
LCGMASFRYLVAFLLFFFTWLCLRWDGGRNRGSGVVVVIVVMVVVVLAVVL